MAAAPRGLPLAAALAAAALLLLAAGAAAGPIPFLVPDGAIKLWSDDFDAPRYSLNSSLWVRVTGKPEWQMQVGLLLPGGVPAAATLMPSRPSPQQLHSHPLLQTFTSDASTLSVANSVAYINAVKQGGAYASARLRSRASWFPGMKVRGRPCGG